MYVLSRLSIRQAAFLLFIFHSFHSFHNSFHSFKGVFILCLPLPPENKNNIETKNKQAANTTEAYKAYLMEVMVALAIQDNQGGIIADPVLIAEKWGISSTEANGDITKARNILSAVRLFISKAVDDNWETKQVKSNKKQSV